MQKTMWLPMAYFSGWYKKRKILNTPMKCLLVIPGIFENSVFNMFHDTLLGVHYGPVNTY